MEYPAVVEFAPFQKISKKKLKKKDAKAGSIEDGKHIFLVSQWKVDSISVMHCKVLIQKFFFTDPEYRKFLESYCADEEKICANPEILLGEIEAKTRELIGLFSWFFFLLRILSILFFYLYYITCKSWPVQSNRLGLSQLNFCYPAKLWQETPHLLSLYAWNQLTLLEVLHAQ